jgi:magnesium transporter
VLIRFLQSTIRHYLEHLKGIKQITTDVQSKINESMGNKYLLQMFSLSESLTYYINAIEANELVLTKLAALGRKAGFTEDQMDLLENAMLDNKQCSRQAEIYSMVLAGLMDARGNIINNNMTVLLKDLTIINIIFLPLNLIASIGGMSEYSFMTKNLDWRVAYALFLVGMVALGWVTWFFLTHILKKR